MDIFLDKITQQAMSYAIRSGIGITASYAIRQSSRLLKTVNNKADYQELHELQRRLDGKIRIISPAIDMIELISARGNTTLESAVSLTKALRWDIQSLGLRLARAANAEEASHQAGSTARNKAAHEMELRLIVKDIKQLLARIEDAVPLINLAITTSGARLTTSLPATVSPSRLLQASTFLTTGDTRYAINHGASVQIGPTFVLSLYMLFSGHTSRNEDGLESARSTTWKEAIHKARIKVMRIPIRDAFDQPGGMPNDDMLLSARSKANEFAYQIDIVEDLDDDRMHSFEDDEPQPGPHDDVALAGIREVLPVYQISKIFYADTGKILNLGGQTEANNPVLLLRRDVNALPPRKMMQEGEQADVPNVNFDDSESNIVLAPQEDDDSGEQSELEKQHRKSRSIADFGDSCTTPQKCAGNNEHWHFPPNLDREWVALEVYNESEDSSSEDGADPNDDSAYASHRPSSSDHEPTEANLAIKLASLRLNKLPSPRRHGSSSQQLESPSPPQDPPTEASPFGPVRSSLSLLEMLIRLTALQQFQQASHLSIPDELLTFFLEESSTTGAGGDGDQRRVTRREARRKVGFDPYDESPIKIRGEEHQYHQQEVCADGYEGYSRGSTPYEESGHNRSRADSQYSRRYTPQGRRVSDFWPSEEQSDPGSQFLPRNGTPDITTPSPTTSYRPNVNRQRDNKPLARMQQERSKGIKTASPLGRGTSVETDSSLGTSPDKPMMGRKG